MPVSLIILLAIYPATFLIAGIFGRLLLPGWPSGNPTESLAKTDEHAIVRINVELPAIHFALLLAGVTAWIWAFPHDRAFASAPSAPGAEGAVLGGIFGMAWSGIWFSLLGIARTPAVLRPVPALGAGLGSQIVLTILGALAVEFWRVMCLGAFLQFGYSNSSAIVFTALAYGAVWVAQSPGRGALMVLEGAFLAVLYVSRGSILTPLTGHLAIDAVFLGALGKRARRQRFGTGRKDQPGACPACGHPLSRMEISLREGFPCPACKAPLSTSTAYRTTWRWAMGFISVIYFFYGFTLFVDQMPVVYVFAIGMFLSLGGQISTCVLIQSLFMPRIQFGDPNFLTLQLGARPPNRPDGPEGS